MENKYYSPSIEVIKLDARSSYCGVEASLQQPDYDPEDKF